MNRPVDHKRPRRIVISAVVDRALADAARQGLPLEVCGLLLGPAALVDGIARIDELAPSPNLAAQEGADRFEIDPALHLRMRREMRGTGRTVLGLYHSHPNGSADASRADHMGGRLEPGLIWLIVPVLSGKAHHPAAYFSTAKGLVPLPLDCETQEGEAQQ